MTPRQLSHRIDNLVESLLAIDFVVLSKPSILKSYPGRRQQIETAVAGDRIPFGNLNSIDAYRNALLAEDYTCILFDGSVIQMSYNFKRGEVSGHRLAFLPSPCGGRLPADDPRPILEVAEGMYSSLQDICFRSAIRFDYAPDDAKTDHPASHIHLNDAETRLSVNTLVMPDQFMRFICCACYSAEWGSVKDIIADPEIASAVSVSRGVTKPPLVVV